MYILHIQILTTINDCRFEQKDSKMRKDKRETGVKQLIHQNGMETRTPTQQGTHGNDQGMVGEGTVKFRNVPWVC
jgi:hypothetical protein